jgi:2-oxoisovalerate dehydrogenase E1 component alpha subunit
MARTKARAAAAPALTAEAIRKAYRDMLLTRTIDERQWVLNRAGKAPFVIPCRGHEAAQVGWGSALRPTDFFLPYYGDLGVVVACGYTARQAMLSLFGKAEDLTSGGRQMPGHYGWRERHIITGSSPVGTQVLHAVGIAYASRLRGEDAVAATALGEGTTSQGDFHEALNWASIFKLPVLFIVENNEYAISVPQHKEMAVQDVSERALGYGMAGVTVDGNDFFACYEATFQAAERGRRGEGPTLLEFKTYRTVPHSSDDDDRAYRTREEVEEWKRKDPITRMQAHVLAEGILTKEEDEALWREVRAEVDEAIAYAEQAPYPKVEDLHRHVYGE